MLKLFPFEEYCRPDQKPDGFRLPVGVNDQDTLEEFTPSDEDRYHILVTGQAGSGKSIYLHTVIRSILQRYTPAEVNLWLCDYTGCEFRKLQAPHITARWQGYHNGEPQELLEALEKEFETRWDLMRDSGARRYEDMPDGKPPRLVVIIDSFGAVSNEMERSGGDFAVRFTRLVRQVHAVGITLVIATLWTPYQECPYFSELSLHIATPQCHENLMFQFRDPRAIEMSRQLRLGEALVDLPQLHKVNLLYLSP